MKTIYDKQWYQFRRKYLQDPDHQYCAICGNSVWSDRDKHGRLLPPEIDHKVRLRDGGGKYDLDNLQVLCHSCHSTKSACEMHRTSVTFTGCDSSGLPLDPNHHWNKPG